MNIDWQTALGQDGDTLNGEIAATKSASGTQPLMMQNPLRSRAVILVFLLVVYLFAVHVPYDFTGAVTLILLFSVGWPLGAFVIFPYAYLFGPALCLVLALFWPGNAGSRLARIAFVLSRASVVVAVLDIGIAPILGGLFSPDAAGSIQLLVAASVLGWQVLVYSWSRQLVRAADVPPRMTTIGWIATMVVTILVVWSVYSGIAAVTQAIQIAGDRPYCLATTDRDGTGGWADNYSALLGLEELRGTRLYTKRTGYKDTSRWYFHAVLIVERELGANEYWNWSIRDMAFDRIARPELQVVSLRNACQPASRFLSRVARW